MIDYLYTYVIAVDCRRGQTIPEGRTNQINPKIWAQRNTNEVTDRVSHQRICHGVWIQPGESPTACRKLGQNSASLGNRNVQEVLGENPIGRLVFTFSDNKLLLQFLVFALTDVI